ncbi:hypothetical protein NY08_3604 [Rhodococcus sp. B7740]|nr:hypothetical protein NY08_3604 [Rhodococcus sp. B7740]
MLHLLRRDDPSLVIMDTVPILDAGMTVRSLHSPTCSPHREYTCGPDGTAT